MRAVIIDDHQEIRSTIRSIIEGSEYPILIEGEAGSVVEGLKLIKSVEPDLIFLDVEMPDGTGFDLLSLLDHENFKVIFVTSHDEFAIKAFRFSAIDYVLKPIDSEELVEAIDKAQKLHSPATHISTLLNNQKRQENKLVLSDQKTTYLVETSEVIRCEADGNYTSFYLTENRRIIVSKTIKNYENLLIDHGFFRTHQSHLINLAFFDRYDRTEGGIIYMKNGDPIPLAIRKKESLMTTLNSFMK